MIRIRTDKHNVTDEDVVILERDLPATITVWEDEQKLPLIASITVDIGTITIEGPDGEELGDWYRKTLKPV